MKITITAESGHFGMVDGIGVDVKIFSFVRRYGWFVTKKNNRWLYPIVHRLKKHSPITIP